MREQIEHFGKRVKSFPEGNKLTRENIVSARNDDRYYLSNFKEEAVALHRDEIKRPQTELALLSYDVNMRFYNALDKNEFECLFLSKANPGQQIKMRVMLFNLHCED